MAAAWEFTIVSKNGISFESLNQMIQEYGNDINVVAAFCIDDWGWSNQHEYSGWFYISCPVIWKSLFRFAFVHTES